MSDWLLPDAHRDSQSITSDWAFTNQRLIDGVKLREVKSVPSGYGFLTEIYRREWALDDLSVDQVFQSTLMPGRVSAWHAHEVTTDRLFVNRGLIHVVLFDARQDSPTFGVLNEFRLGSIRPGLVVIPPKVWHGVQNIADQPSSLVNLVDQAYRYENPDHWRVPPDSPHVPYRFRKLERE
jgi:dTDP-4-dehydrorhamnose 3,5-epimerase